MKTHKDIVVDFVNSTRPELRLLKLDEQTGKPVSGATFFIEEVGGGFSDRRQTDKDGLIVLGSEDGLRPGVFQITEVVAAPNYVLDDTVHTVVLEENRSTTIELTKGLLDFGLLIEPVDLKKYDHFHLPVTDSWGVLMRRDSPLAEKDSIHPKDLWNVPLLISRQSMIEHGLSNWMRRNYNELDIAGTYNLLFNAALMVEAGMGYAVCLDKLVNTMDTSGLCFRPLAGSQGAGMDIAWKKYQVFSKASQKFLERLQESFSEDTLRWTK